MDFSNVVWARHGLESYGKLLNARLSSQPHTDNHCGWQARPTKDMQLDCLLVLMCMWTFLSRVLIGNTGWLERLKPLVRINRSSWLPAREYNNFMIGAEGDIFSDNGMTTEYYGLYSRFNIHLKLGVILSLHIVFSLSPISPLLPLPLSLSLTGHQHTQVTHIH